MTKSNKLTNKTKNEIIVKDPIASQYYEDDNHPLHTSDDKIFDMKDSNQVPVASEQKLLIQQLLNTNLH